MEKNIRFNYKNKDYEFPLVKGSEGEIGIDIKKLRQETGLITLDPGYKNTGSCLSEITYLDGENGILRYRGYDIEELANNSSFIEVSYLLIFGEMPFNPGSVDVNSEEKMYQAIVQLIAKFSVITAWVHRKVKGLPLNYSDNSLPYVENLAQMMFSKPNEQYQNNPVISSALNKLLILHADHEQNCSTSTVRIVGSSEAGLFASISAGISALWGRLHGGANQAVIEMLELIKRDGGDTSKFMIKAKDKNHPFRLMGFGHRVYKNFDPRAKIIKKTADDVLKDLGIVDPILDIAKKLEHEALNDKYFVDRKLYPNVDFYSGIIYRALDIPTEMFTVMFALGRLSGWITQWKEMRLNKEPIGRPRQIYNGSISRKITSKD